MKKIMIMLAMLTMTMVAKAQFEAGKAYVNGSLSGMDLSFSGTQQGKFDIGAMVGYFVEDQWLIDVQAGLHHPGKGGKATTTAGVGGRYYVLDNGLFLGANCKLLFSPGHNDVMPGIELGYCFFLNDKLTVEPSVYYDQSLRKHSDYSTVGLKVSVGVYF
jgi:hypothetical protein